MRTNTSGESCPVQTQFVIVAMQCVALPFSPNTAVYNVVGLCASDPDIFLVHEMCRISAASPGSFSCKLLALKYYSELQKTTTKDWNARWIFMSKSAHIRKAFSRRKHRWKTLVVECSPSSTASIRCAFPCRSASAGLNPAKCIGPPCS